jgi:hypothetical protein
MSEFNVVDAGVRKIIPCEMDLIYIYSIINNTEVKK